MSISDGSTAGLLKSDSAIATATATATASASPENERSHKMNENVKETQQRDTSQLLQSVDALIKARGRLHRALDTVEWASTSLVSWQQLCKTCAASAPHSWKSFLKSCGANMQWVRGDCVVGHAEALNATVYRYSNISHSIQLPNGESLDGADSAGVAKDFHHAVVIPASGIACAVAHCSPQTSAYKSSWPVSTATVDEPMNWTEGGSSAVEISGVVINHQLGLLAVVEKSGECKILDECAAAAYAGS